MPIASAIGGAVVSGLFADRQQSSAQGFTKEQLQNRHQWETLDLESAGLNRILGYTKGGPPIGGSPVASLPDLASTAVQAQRLKQEIKNLEAKEKQTVAETKFTESKTDIAEPFKAVGTGLGAIATPIAEWVESIAIEMPANAKQAKGWLDKQMEKVKQYLFERSHRNEPFHKRGEIKR